MPPQPQAAGGGMGGGPTGASGSGGQPTMSQQNLNQIVSSNNSSGLQFLFLAGFPKRIVLFPREASESYTPLKYIIIS